MEIIQKYSVSKVLTSSDLLVASCASVVGISSDILQNFLSKRLINESIMDNKYTMLFKPCMIREIIDSMNQKVFSKGSFIMQEKELGKYLYVIEDGKFKVEEEGKSEEFEGKAGHLYGVEEFLMGTKMLKSIKAITECKVWTLDKKVFKLIMKKSTRTLATNLDILKNFDLFKEMNEVCLSKIADAIVLEYYGSQELINIKSNTLYVISSGSVACVRNGSYGKEQIMEVLSTGDHFKPLKESCYQFRAFYPGVELLLIEMQIFPQMEGGNEHFQRRIEKTSSKCTTEGKETMDIFSEAKIKLKDLKSVAILGRWNFGRVDLVCSKDPMKMKPYALKQLEKYRTVRKQEQSLVINEKNVLMKCDHPFIVRLHKTFRDEQFVYMLFEACLGGPLRKILNKKHYFPEKTARFVVASVVEALEYLHGKHIIYRDLKPDNVVIDEKGFVKLVDFGLSKQLGYSGRTWSFCGTANNIAPEIILNVGHDRAVDYWALGMFIYELLCGFTLFSDFSPMKAYDQIIEGMDNIKFSSRLIGRTAEDLVRKLCRSEPTERLGYQRTSDIKQHRWFKGFDWSGLISRTVAPPACLKPTLTDSYDTSNFDYIKADPCYFPLKENSNWDEGFERR